MKMHMIATIVHGDKYTGFRILDSDETKTLDVPLSKVAAVLKSGIVINNLKIKDGEVVGSNGALSRFASIDNTGNIKGTPLVVLYQIEDAGYMVSDYKGTILALTTKQVISYASKYGIANGKIVDKNGEEFISAIFGNYENIPITKTKLGEKSKTSCIGSETKKSSEPIETKRECVETTDTQIEIKSKSGDKLLSLTLEQQNALKLFYKWAEINREQASAEINKLNAIVKMHMEKSEYAKIRLVYEVIAVMNTPKEMVKVFGTELTEHIMRFVATRLPFPESLVIKCSEAISSNLREFLIALGKTDTEYVKAVQNLLDNPSHRENTFDMASEMYIKCFTTDKLLGGYSNNSTEYDVDTIKRYCLCSRFDVIELKELLFVLNTKCYLKERLIDYFKMSLGLSKHRAFVNVNDVYTLIQYIQDIKDCGIDLDIRRFYLYLIGMYPECCSTRELVIDGVITKPALKYFENSLIESESSCKFCSTPSVESIDELYQTIIKGITGFGYYNKMVTKAITSDITSIEEYHRNDVDSNSISGETEHIDNENELLHGFGKTSVLTDIEKAIREKDTALLKQLNAVEVYKSLRQSLGKNLKGICFTISDSMMEKGMSVAVMSPKQRFRLNEAVDKLLELIKSTDSNSAGTETITEQTQSKYTILTDESELMAKIKALKDEERNKIMKTVLSVYPTAINVCNTVLAYSRYSERQRLRIEQAYDKLMELQKS